MPHNICEEHNRRYTHACWECEYEAHLPEEYVQGWEDRMANALIINQRAHDAIMRDVQEVTR